VKQADVGSLTARYESLRRSALGQEPPGGHGLALVIHRGISAWILAWGELYQDPARSTVSRADPNLSAVEIPELVQTLTSLALGAIRG